MGIHSTAVNKLSLSMRSMLDIVDTEEDVIIVKCTPEITANRTLLRVTAF